MKTINANSAPEVIGSYSHATAVNGLVLHLTATIEF